MECRFHRRTQKSFRSTKFFWRVGKVGFRRERQELTCIIPQAQGHVRLAGGSLTIELDVPVHTFDRPRCRSERSLFGLDRVLALALAQEVQVLRTGVEGDVWQPASIRSPSGADVEDESA